MAKDNQNKNLPDSEYPASASEPSGLFGLFGKGKPKIDPAAMNGVYAGPAQLSNYPPMPMQTVYAGPEFFSGPKPSIPAGAAGPIDPDAQPTPSVPSAFKDYDGPLVTCQVCGHSVPAGMKFCPECGSPFPRENKTEQC